MSATPNSASTNTPRCGLIATLLGRNKAKDLPAKCDTDKDTTNRDDIIEDKRYIAREVVKNVLEKINDFKVLSFDFDDPDLVSELIDQSDSHFVFFTSNFYVVDSEVYMASRGTGTRGRDQLVHITDIQTFIKRGLRSLIRLKDLHDVK